MKTDLYTKAVLTVIAVALVCLVFQNFDIATPVHASASPAPKEVLNVRISDIAYNLRFPVNIESSQTLPVKIENTVPVKADIHSSPLPVKIVSSSPLPVKVENTVTVKSK